MTGKNLRDRISKLEAACTKTEDPALCQETFLRVRAALIDALAASHRAVLCTLPGAGPGSVFSFADAVQELYDRVDLGRITCGDRRVLEALPADDLQRLNMSPEYFVAVYSEMFKRY